MVSSEVSGPRTTSISGSRKGGFHQLATTTLSGLLVAGASWLDMKEDVLLDSMVRGGESSSSRAKTSCLMSMSSNTASTTKSTSATVSAREVLVCILDGTAAAPASSARPTLFMVSRLTSMFSRAFSRLSSVVSFR